jgi:aryl-alcohol dehydrogenase-like predicted oxidoreductase
MDAAIPACKCAFLQGPDCPRQGPALRAPASRFDPATDLRAEFERFTPRNLAANRAIVTWLAAFATSKNATPAQIALAWLLAQKPWIVPIPGTRNPAHLDENLQSIGVELSPSDLAQIGTALSEFTVHGGRMNAELRKVVDETR